MEHGEHEPEIDGDGRLAGEQGLDALREREVSPVDLVVEGDHLVSELGVLLAERAQRPAQRPENQLRLLLKHRLELIELFLECDSHRH